MAEKTRGSNKASRTPGRGSAAAALARFYDLDLEDDPGDLDMYLAFAAAAGGSILELMAGSGRIAVPLAAAGHKVTGVDRDPAMLERAASHWQRAKTGAAKGGSLELLQMDVTQLALGKRFDLVIVALNSLLLLEDRDAQRGMFRIIAAHLAKGGRAVIDVWLPAPEDLVLYDGRLILDWLRRDDETGEQIAKTTAARYESGARTARVTSLFDSWRAGETPRRVAREGTITFISIDELQRFAGDAGLNANTIAGDYEMGHITPSSERVVMVCNL